MHALISLKQEYKINIVEQVDKIACAEFPYPVLQPTLFEIFKKCMIHRPYGSRHMNTTCVEPFGAQNKKIKNAKPNSYENL